MDEFEENLIHKICSTDEELTRDEISYLYESNLLKFNSRCDHYDCSCGCGTENNLCHDEAEKLRDNGFEQDDRWVDEEGDVELGTSGFILRDITEEIDKLINTKSKELETADVTKWADNLKQIQTTIKDTREAYEKMLKGA